MFEGRAEVELIDEVNRIEVAAIDVRGQSSLRAEVRLRHKGNSGRALWFAGFGISDYRLAWLPRLFYLAKDARDIGAALTPALDDSFDAVNVRTWTDDEVSETTLAEAHARLAQAAPGDQVVFFIAGHGTYGFDDDSRFYYLLPESDEDDLAGTALDFEQVEAVLFGLEARDKLFLMDTSPGEPIGSMELARYDAAVEAGVLRVLGAGRRRAARRGRQRIDATATRLATATRPFRLRRSRTTKWRRRVLVGHEQQALQRGFVSPQWLLTQGLLNALSSEDADLDGDGALAISELYDKVEGQVQDWSDLGEGPTQNPVIDRDNLRAALPLLPEDVRASSSRRADQTRSGLAALNRC